MSILLEPMRLQVNHVQTIVRPNVEVYLFLSKDVLKSTLDRRLTFDGRHLQTEHEFFSIKTRIS